MKLHVHAWGEEGSPLAVCLHGVTSHGGRFRRLAAALGAHHRVLAPDLRGHGHSGWEPPWTLDAHVGDVLESAEGRAAAWIGHSFGARIAAEVAARQPGAVERLVLLDPALQVLPHVAFDLAELERREMAFAHVEEAVQLRFDSGRVSLAPRELVLEDEVDHLERGADGLLRYRYCKGAVIAAWSEMATAPPPAAQVPTLILRGAESWLFLDEQVAAYERELGDLLEVVGVPGGHTVMWDALEETIAAVGAFLR